MKRNGFTLIELIIVVALIGVIASIAIPAYKSHVTRTYRVNAEQSLIQLAMDLERYRIKNGAYAYRIKEISLATSDGTAVLTKVLVDFDSNEGELVTFNIDDWLEHNTVKFYDLSAENTDYEFQLTATPKEGQKTDGQLFVNQCGFQGWDKDNNAPPAPFWYDNCGDPKEHYEISFPY